MRITPLSMEIWECFPLSSSFWFLLLSFNTNRCSSGAEVRINGQSDSTLLKSYHQLPKHFFSLFFLLFYECCFWILNCTRKSALRSHQLTFSSTETQPCTYFTIDSIKQTFMTNRQEAMKNTRSSKWKNNNSEEKNDIVKYGFVIILIKIVEYNDPEALGTLKKVEKQTCVWQSMRPASGCGNIPDCLAGASDCRFSHYLNSLLQHV